jgi:hypothetical protein
MNGFGNVVFGFYSDYFTLVELWLFVLLCRKHIFYLKIKRNFTSGYWRLETSVGLEEYKP